MIMILGEWIRNLLSFFDLIVAVTPLILSEDDSDFLVVGRGAGRGKRIVRAK
jgi:hypothetical protein